MPAIWTRFCIRNIFMLVIVWFAPRGCAHLFGAPKQAASSALRSHSIPCAPTPEVAALIAHEAGEHHVVHLGSAVDEARLAGVAVDPFQNSVLGIAARAVELNADVGGLMQRVGDVHLGHGDFLARAIALI